MTQSKSSLEDIILYRPSNIHQENNMIRVPPGTTIHISMGFFELEVVVTVLSLAMPRAHLSCESLLVFGLKACWGMVV